MNLIELTHKNDILQTYEIYKHCMFMPTEEKFNQKVEQFLNNSISFAVHICKYKYLKNCDGIYFSPNSQIRIE